MNGKDKNNFFLLVVCTYDTKTVAKISIDFEIKNKYIFLNMLPRKFMFLSCVTILVDRRYMKLKLIGYKK